MPPKSQYLPVYTSRCAGSEEDTAVITSPSNEIHSFSWELLAFKYFGGNSVVVFTCEVLVCKNDPFSQLSNECKRCGQTSNRRRRAVEGDGKAEPDVLEKTFVSTQRFLIVDRRNVDQVTSDQSRMSYLIQNRILKI